MTFSPFKTQNLKTFLGLTAIVLLGASAASALPLGDILEPMPTADEAAVTAAAQDQIKNQTTRIKSVAQENLTFEGSFTPSSADVKLAVVSDDGVTVTINGQATNVANFGQGQNFDDFGKAFQVIKPPIDFVAGTPVTIKVQYSNTIHAGAQDFDGITLFVYGGTAQVPEVNLVLHNGQGGAAVVDSKEETVGAFTVANLNNTDYDATVDNSDNDVPGEKDLMALEISRPTGPSTDTLTITPNRAYLWETSSKGTRFKSGSMPATITLGELPKTVWVEVTQISDALRDVSVELNYKGQKDVVKATGVWANFVAAAHDTKDATTLFNEPAWQDTTEQPKDLIVDRGGVGLRPINGTNGSINAILIKFTLLPVGIASAPGVSFDITRQAEGKIWVQTQGGAEQIVPEGTRIFPDSDEEPNDAVHNDDESIAPSPLGNIYSMDAPGLGSIRAPMGVNYFTFRSNFREYVRVTFDGVHPLGNSVIGSRCSSKYLWHVSHKFDVSMMGFYRRTTGDAIETAENEIGDGNIVIGGP